MCAADSERPRLCSNTNWPTQSRRDKAPAGRRGEGNPRTVITHCQASSVQPLFSSSRRERCFRDPLCVPGIRLGFRTGRTCASGTPTVGKRRLSEGNMEDLLHVFHLNRLLAFLYEAYPWSWLSLWWVDIPPFASCPALCCLYRCPHHDWDYALGRIRNTVLHRDSRWRRTPPPIPSPLATFPRPAILLRLVDNLLG